MSLAGAIKFTKAYSLPGSQKEIIIFQWYIYRRPDDTRLDVGCRVPF
jgi:hypothetical protein